jgi:hypothetical protein
LEDSFVGDVAVWGQFQVSCLMIGRVVFVVVREEFIRLGYITGGLVMTATRTIVSPVTEWYWRRPWFIYNTA